MAEIGERAKGKLFASAPLFGCDEEKSD
jgi:hypothetical protein